MEVKIIVTIPF